MQRSEVLDRVRRTTKRAVPQGVQRWRTRMLLRAAERRFGGRTNAEIFGQVYDRGHWGSTAAFDSGAGSHRSEISAPYVDAVGAFLGSLDPAPTVVDIGCGDFTVGSQLTGLAKSYVACDVVPALVEANRRRYVGDNVEFRVLDAVRDPLPEGDVVVIRQVLQHLSNDAILQVLPKLSRYAHAVITEHQPEGDFVPNLDIPTGPHIRIGINSGVDLASPPFALRYREATEICTVPGDGSGVIRTVVYTL